MNNTLNYVKRVRSSSPDVLDVATTQLFCRLMAESSEQGTTVHLREHEIVQMEAALERLNRWLTARRTETALPYTPKRMHYFIPTGLSGVVEHFT